MTLKEWKASWEFGRGVKRQGRLWATWSEVDQLPIVVYALGYV
jgi:hypothetical protein